MSKKAISIKPITSQRLMIGNIELNLGVMETSDKGMRYVMSARSNTCLADNQYSFVFSYTIDIKELEEPFNFDVFTMSSSSKLKDVNDLYKGWEDNIESIIFEMLSLLRLHIRCDAVNYVTQDQYAEIFYQVYEHLCKPLGFTGQHIADMRDSENAFGQFTYTPNEFTYEELGHCGDLRMLMTACFFRNAQPDWVRNGIGQVTATPKHHIRGIKKC